jgi:hypothetical protein
MLQLFCIIINSMLYWFNLLRVAAVGVAMVIYTQEYLIEEKEGVKFFHKISGYWFTPKPIR